MQKLFTYVLTLLYRLLGLFDFLNRLWWWCPAFLPSYSLHIPLLFVSHLNTSSTPRWSLIVLLFTMSMFVFPDIAHSILISFFLNNCFVFFYVRVSMLYAFIDLTNDLYILVFVFVFKYLIFHIISYLWAPWTGLI